MKTQVLSIIEEDGKDILVLAYEKIAKELRLDLSVLEKEHGRNAKLHGWKQRFGDLKSGDETGHEKFAEVQRLYEHLKEGGDWAMTGQRDTTGVVIEALNRLNPKKYTKELLQKAIEAKPEQVKTWRANPEVKAMIAKIYAERAAKVAKEQEAVEVKIELS
jgi:hypothetical protein